MPGRHSGASHNAHPADDAVKLRPLLLALLGLHLGGCSGLGYYAQAALGQADIWSRSQSVTAVQAESTTPAALHAQLQLAQSIRSFATTTLGLPDNDSYRRYADVGRPFVVWNVFATAPYSVEPLQWCFLVAGCVSYRGHFAEATAQADAANLRARGLDVHIAGVSAYSTLGWFDDPLLNTFIHYPELELARLIFHELAHQVVYVPDDTEFNESFAVAVETEGLRRWVHARGEPDLAEQLAATQERRDDFTRLVQHYREALRSAYSEETDDHARARRKRDLIQSLRDEYRELREGPWKGYRGYDRWFGQEINNATLASIGLYSGLVPAFIALLEAERGNLPRFYTRVAALKLMAKDERRAALRPSVSTPASNTRPD